MLVIAAENLEYMVVVTIVGFLGMKMLVTVVERLGVRMLVTVVDAISSS